MFANMLCLLVDLQWNLPEVSALQKAKTAGYCSRLLLLCVFYFVGLCGAVYFCFAYFCMVDCVLFGVVHVLYCVVFCLTSLACCFSLCCCVFVSSMFVGIVFYFVWQEWCGSLACWCIVLVGFFICCVCLVYVLSIANVCILFCMVEVGVVICVLFGGVHGLRLAIGRLETCKPTRQPLSIGVESDCTGQTSKCASTAGVCVASGLPMINTASLHAIQSGAEMAR